jgi:hypothetical protein
MAARAQRMARGTQYAIRKILTAAPSIFCGFQIPFSFTRSRRQRKWQWSWGAGGAAASALRAARADAERARQIV